MQSMRIMPIECEAHVLDQLEEVGALQNGFKSSALHSDNDKLMLMALEHLLCLRSLHHKMCLHQDNEAAMKA